MESHLEKYYQPDITEFRIGFEYEALVDYYKEEYEKFIIEDTDSMRSILNTWDRGEDEYWRVKYLDREDIEGLGFKIHTDINGCTWFEKGGKRWVEIKFLHSRDSWSQIRIKHYLHGVKFLGFIKNLSELKQVLTMIGVDYEG